MTLFVITNYQKLICWMICFIFFVRLAFPYWLWRRVILSALFLLRAHGGFDRSTEDAYICVTPYTTFAFVWGSCCPTLDFAFLIILTFYTLVTLLACILINILIHPELDHIAIALKTIFWRVCQGLFQKVCLG
jgi:hypothetical protein